MQFSAGDGRASSGLLLMAAAGVLYGASRVAVFALARPDGSDAGRRSAAQALPIAATVLMALLLRKPDVAVSVIFGASVACLSLVLGMATYLAPIEHLPPTKRVWPFVLPAALLPLMAGFSGHLNWIHAFMMLGLGGSLLLVWLAEPESGSPTPVIALSAADGTDLPVGGRLPLAGAIVLALIGAYMAVQGTYAASRHSQMVSAGTIAATILSPLLVLPTMGTAMTLAQRDQTGRAVSALVGTVLLNLCGILPIGVLLWYAISGFTGTTFGHGLSAAWQAIGENAQPLPYAMATWRIETVMLVVLGFGLYPVAMGRLRVGRVESAALVLGYAAYLAVLAAFSIRMP